MAKLTVPLTSTKIEASKPQDKDYSLFDGNGLILLVRTTGTKTWRYRYKNSSGTQILTLGTYPALNLKQARNLRAEFESMLANGQDPKAQKALKEAKASNANSLEKVTRAWLDVYAKKSPLSEYTKHKRLRKFENHLFPKFKGKAIDQIQLRELKDALNTIYEHSPDNAQRIRADLVLIFGYAKQHSLLEINIARELDDMDLSASTQHRATFSKGELDRIPQLIQRIKSDTGHPITKLCLLIALHTFVRSSEIRFARWSEINLDKMEWKIPAQREFVNGVKHSDRGAKMKIEHIVPLSKQVVNLFKELYQYTGKGEFVFSSPKSPSTFLSENTPNDALHRMGYTKEEISLHGFRALARSALAEMSLFSKEALEKQMSHKEKNAVVDAYTHIAEYLEERRRIMSVWSAWLNQIENGEYVKPYLYGESIKNKLGA